MKDRFLWYRIKREVLLSMMGVVLALVVWGLLITLIDKEASAIALDVMIFNMVLLGFRPGEVLEQYMNFGFSRKRFFNNQVVIIFVQSVILATLRSVVQYLCYDKYLATFIEGTDHTLEMYHTVPFVELFVSNIVIFMILLLMGTLGVATGYKWFSMWQRADVTVQLKNRIVNRKKEKKGTFATIFSGCVKAVSFLLFLIFIVGIELAIVMFFWFEMLYEPIYRIAIIFGIFVIFMIMYVIGMCLYKPKYV